MHYVIVGFSREDGIAPTLFMENSTVKHVANINGYLEDKANVALARHKHPISDVLPVVRGCQPTDSGNLILDLKEGERLFSRCPEAATWVKPFSMGADFINNKEQFCLWLVDITQGELAAMPIIAERVREMRLASKKAATRKKAETPWLLDEVRPP